MTSKPMVLYHGSSQKIEGELTPVLVKSSEDHLHNLPVVFATEDIAAATLFMMPPSVLFSIGLEQGISYVCIWGTPEEFAKKDHGGYLYFLSSETFVKRGKGYEWQSDVAVMPQEVKSYGSVLDAFRENGVRTYFINDDELFDRIRAKKEPRLEILKDVKPWNR